MSGVNQIDEFVGQNVRALRRQAAKSMEVLAKESSIGLGDLKAIEAGEKRASASQLFAISEALDAEVRDFFKELQTVHTP